jgi:anaerobic magnesium-protoporphyrin IX monomethyl ester cyclase
MKAAIIVPPSDFLDDDRVFPPLGAYYIKRYVEENSKHTVTIFSNDEMFNIENFEVIGFSATTPQYSKALYMMNILPPWITTVIGGPHVHHYSTEKDLWDYVITGDGCKSFLDILNGRYPEEKLDDKNQLPHRDESFHRYKYYLDGNPTTVIMTARGCPNGCAFCEDARTNVRLKNPEIVKQEIQECVDLGFSGIMFFDDLFCLNLKRVRELCAVIKPFNIKFRCFAHAMNFTDEMAKMLADAGCVEIGYGAECLDQDILDTINKQTTVKQIYKLVNTAHKYGIRVKAFLMLGLPGETKESARKMEEFVMTSGVDDFDVSIYYPYKGTYIADHIDDYDLIIEKGYSSGFYKGKLGYAECVVRTPALSASEIKQLREKIYSHNKRFKAVVPKPGL